MIQYFLYGLTLAFLSSSVSYAQVKAPESFGPVPNANQMRWQKMEYYAFVHFSLNTYTNQSWGFGNEDVKLFNPEKLDCRHVIREMADACKEYGLKLRIYLSPWDRNHSDYEKPEYIAYFRNQLTELLTNYGPIFEIWFDGANGGTGYYGGANENRK